MSTPLTPGMSTLLFIPKDNQNYSENTSSALATSSLDGNANFQQQNSSFHDNDNKALDHNDQYFNYLLAAQVVQSGYQASFAANSRFGESHRACLFSHNLNANQRLRYLTGQGYVNNLSQNSQRLFGENNTTTYGHIAEHNSTYLPPQPQYHSDTFGNVILPLQVINEQSDLQNLFEHGFSGAKLDYSFLIPSPLPPNEIPLKPKQRSSKSTSARSICSLVTPLSSPATVPTQPVNSPVKFKRRRRRKPIQPPEVVAAKHKAFLQRNREASLKCRTKKKAYINGLEEEEIVSRQVNSVLKDELKNILGEVLLLREQVRDILCEEECEGRTAHAPTSKGSLAAVFSVGTESVVARSSIGANSVADSGQEESESFEPFECR